MRDLYRTHTPTISLRPEAALTLSELQRRGHPLGLITDGRIVTQRLKIEALKLGRWFAPEFTLISEAIGRSKSSGEPFRIMERRMSGLAHNFIYVGDNPAKDIEWPAKLGWTTVLIADNGSHIHPQPPCAASSLKIQTLHELLDIC